MAGTSDYGVSGEDRILAARVAEAIAFVSRSYRPKFIGFLDRRQQMIAAREAAHAREDVQLVIWGGLEEADRAYAGFFPPYGEPDRSLFPISALRFKWKFGSLSHRDFLGALLSIGIERDTVGDILVLQGVCDILVDSSIAGFIQQNLEKVGGSGVSCEPVPFEKLEKKQEFLEISDTIASPRLDCAVASLISRPRAEAVRLILGGNVSVDFEPAADPAGKISDGLTVSIRGHGRFVIDGIGPVTRKGRLRFSARKYC